MKLNTKIFFSFSGIFLLMMVAIATFQYGREKHFRREQLDARLTDYNLIMHKYISECPRSFDELFSLVLLMPDSGLRVTLIDTVGFVLFDSEVPEGMTLENHLQRPEIQDLKKDMSGRNIRLSASTGKYYYYVVQRFPDVYVRTALPYNLSLKGYLSANMHFLYFMGLMLIVVMVVLYWISNSFLRSVERNEHELKRQLIQNISHELKTPVSSILGYMESILSNPTIDGERKLFFIERAFHQAERLKVLLQDITILNKLDDARELYEKTPCDLTAVVQEVLSDLCLQIGERDMAVVCELKGELPIFGNRSLLYSIFRNLVENALMYGGEKVCVKIRLALNEKRFYRFEVSDNGVGIPEEHLMHIFDRFYRVDSGRNRKLGGTGLGLSIVKNAVLFHHGTISVANAPAGGLFFLFTLRKY